LTVAERKGLSLSAAWDNYKFVFWISLAALAFLAYRVIREGTADKTLFLGWSVLMLVAAFGQQRFEYYLAVNLALLTAYCAWMLLSFVGLGEASEEAAQELADKDARLQKEKEKSRLSKKAKRREKSRKREPGILTTRYLSAKHAYGFIAVIVVFFVAFFPNIGNAIDWAEPVRGATDDWHESLSWMRENTPEPFLDPELYYEKYEKPAAGEVYDYPESAYGVLSWWDYGYWITYIAHRIPNANPSGSRGAKNAGTFFTTGNETQANEVLNKVGTKYVIIDYQMATGKYYAMVEFAGKDQDDFFEVYYQRQANRFAPILMYYPAYYQSLCSRLYNFGGEKWVPQEILTISWTEEYLTGADGSRFKAKIISDDRLFTDYDEAQAFTEANPNYKIVGTNTFTSPVPLEELEHYKLIHKSPTTYATRGEESLSLVEVFEYSP
jgi:dolichyl-diphosphooligosaccharide--protein glycosyltransferase